MVVTWGHRSSPLNGPRNGRSHGQSKKYCVYAGLTTVGDFLGLLHLLHVFWGYRGAFGPHGDNRNKQDTWQSNSLTRFKLTRKRLVWGFVVFFFLFNFFLPPRKRFLY